MKPTLLAVILCGGLSATLWAQEQAAPESLTAWPYFKEIQNPTDHTLVRVLLDRDVLDKSRDDAADLRIYDGAGREVPYELTVLRDVDSHSLFTGREFNRAAEGNTALISCDLGENHPHNEVQVATSGNNFRRIVRVDGSADGSQWATLAAQGILFRFSSGGRTVEQSAIEYPLSNYRYLRVRVERDPEVDTGAPQVISLAVLRAEHRKGETISFAAAMEGREADPFQGRPASIWQMDLGGRIPLQSVTINVDEAAFSRPFQLEAVDDPASPRLLASGTLTRTEERGNTPVQIDFTEQFARRLKLTVVDDRNAPLTVNGIIGLSAARQVVLRADAGTLRFYYGNPKAIAPHYDPHLPVDRAFSNPGPPLGPEHANPIYHPEPKPWSERSPWLVYLVLTGACAALAAILLNLAKASARAREDLSATPSV